MSRKKAILVVHDDPAVIGVIKPILDSLGFDVTATSSEECLSTFDRVSPCFVVLAPCIPADKRWQLPAEMRSRNPKVTVFQLDSMSAQELQKQLATGASGVQ